MLVEVYPAKWRRGFARDGRTADQHDAYTLTVWLQQVDFDSCLAVSMKLPLAPGERAVAQVEAGILGVM